MVEPTPLKNMNQLTVGITIPSWDYDSQLLFPISSISQNSHFKKSIDLFPLLLFSNNKFWSQSDAAGAGFLGMVNSLRDSPDGIGQRSLTGLLFKSLESDYWIEASNTIFKALKFILS